MEELKFTICSDNIALAAAIEHYLNSTKSSYEEIYIINTLIESSTSLQFPQSVNKIVEELDGSKSNIKDSIGNLFFKYLIDVTDSNVDDIHESCSYYPRVSSYEVSEILNEIELIIQSYVNFKNIIEEKVFSDKEHNEFEIYWNDFQLENIIPNGKKKVFLFNAQTATKKLWENLVKIFFETNKIENTLFIFYYSDYKYKYNCNNRIKLETFENEDKLFGYSRFFRDFLVEKGIGYNILVNDVDLENILKVKKNYIKWEGLKPSEYFAKQIDRINFSINKVYGNNFSSPFSLEKTTTIPLISEFYTYNKNSFASDLSAKQIELLSDDGNELSSSVSSHSVMNEYEKQIKEFPINRVNKGEYSKYYNNGGKIQFWNHFRKSVSALLRSFIAFTENVSPRFLFLDDNVDPLIPKLEVLEKWFNKPEIFYVDKFEWKKFFHSEGKLINTKLNKLALLNRRRTTQFGNTIKEIKPDFIVIDLDYKGQLVGYDLLRKLRSEIKHIKGKVIYLIVLSRYEDPYVIRTAINNGALLYITKSNFLRIIYKIYQLNFDYSRDHRKYYNYENWHLLSKLEPSKIARLKTDRIFGNEYNFENLSDRWCGDEFSFTADYQWIKKLPKADLHCHIGSCMSPDLLPKTAALVLAEKYKNEKKIDEKLKPILEFLIPIVLDPYINEISQVSTDNHPLTIQYKESFRLDSENIENQSLFQIISDNFKLTQNKVNPETTLLDPIDSTLERLTSLKNKTDSTYFINKWLLRKNKISYDEVMLFFVLLLSIREKISNRESIGIEEHLNGLKEFLEIATSQIDPDIYVTFNDVELLYESIIRYLKENCFLQFLSELKSNGKNLIKFLQSAHSINRCLPDKGKAIKDKASLFNYLRGCEYAGAAHLQTKAAIYLTTNYLINIYSRKENIRYIGLRCAVDGYSKMNLQTKEIALETLLRGLDYFSREACEKGFKTHINLILTAKRHKSLKAFEENVELALKYRHGLAISDKINEQRSFFPSSSKVVSFDLAGIEKGNRPSKFYQQFLPLLRKCFPITIHAGEEDDYESIWEAIYLVQSQRIGHGLTLRQDEDLLKIVRERHVTIELCPLSNLMTNSEEGYIPITPDEFEIESKKLDKTEYIKLIKKRTSYPLRQYLDENLDVTINTDNPFVNSATLTQEYLVAAKLIGGLSKWEILRLIKNSFRGTAIPKEEKRKLMDEIDDEIFEILLNED